jgi:hypothetical protein
VGDDPIFAVYVLTAKDITAHGVAKAVGEYLGSQNAAGAIHGALSEDAPDGGAEDAPGDAPEGGPGDAPEDAPESAPEVQPSTRIRARTARRWLSRLGLKFKDFTKDVYQDGHERADVVSYRNNVFLPAWRLHSPRFVIFDEDGSWTAPDLQGSKPIVFITHDESTFNANDGQRRGWVAPGSQKIRPKGKGRGIMVSAFLTPGGILAIPGNVPDSDLLADPSWPRLADGSPVREAVEYLEYGADNYWTSDKMLSQVENVAVRIFARAFPGCIGLWAFDNATNHCAYAEDALVVRHMNLKPGGKQKSLRRGYFGEPRTWQPMTFPGDHHDAQLQGKPKGIEQVLRERGLWRDRNPDGSRFLLHCSKSGDGQQCAPVMQGTCCASSLLTAQPDFMEQTGLIEERLLAAGQLVIFYPKFHCELNFIERFWSSAKHHARENCSYSLLGLRRNVPAAVHSVPTVTVNRYYHKCVRIIDAYQSGCTYGTAEFVQRTQKTHRRPDDQDKW